MRRTNGRNAETTPLHDCRQQEGREVPELLKAKILAIREWLNENDRPGMFRRWDRADEPARIKHVQKIAAAMLEILASIEERSQGQDRLRAGGKNDKGRRAGDSPCERDLALRSLLQQIGDPRDLSAGNARELADLFEIEVLRRSTPHRLQLLAQAQNTREKGTFETWRQYFDQGLVQREAEKPAQVRPGAPRGRLPWFGKPREKTPSAGSFAFSDVVLETARLELMEYRRRDTEIGVRGTYLSKLSFFLGTVMLLVVASYIAIAVLTPQAPSSSPAITAQADQRAVLISVVAPSASAGGIGRSALLVLLVCASGAFGSVLSRAIKLSRSVAAGAGRARQGLVAGPDLAPAAAENVAGQDAPVGIQALLADQTAFFAQLLIGGASALVFFLAVSAHLILPELNTTGDLAGDLARLTALAFLAGFSEPFFLGTVEKINVK